MVAVVVEAMAVVVVAASEEVVVSEAVAGSDITTSAVEATLESITEALSAMAVAVAVAVVVIAASDEVVVSAVVSEAVAGSDIATSVAEATMASVATSLSAMAASLVAATEVEVALALAVAVMASAVALCSGNSAVAAGVAETPWVAVVPATLRAAATWAAACVRNKGRESSSAFWASKAGAGAVITVPTLVATLLATCSKAVESEVGTTSCRFDFWLSMFAPVISKTNDNESICCNSQ